MTSKLYISWDSLRFGWYFLGGHTFICFGAIIWPERMGFHVGNIATSAEVTLTWWFSKGIHTPKMTLMQVRNTTNLTSAKAAMILARFTITSGHIRSNQCNQTSYPIYPPSHFSPLSTHAQQQDQQTSACVHHIWSGSVRIEAMLSR